MERGHGADRECQKRISCRGRAITPATVAASVRGFWEANLMAPLERQPRRASWLSRASTKDMEERKSVVTLLIIREKDGGE
jgi:hypothetical protein